MHKSEGKQLSAKFEFAFFIVETDNSSETIAFEMDLKTEIEFKCVECNRKNWNTVSRKI